MADYLKGLYCALLLGHVAACVEPDCAPGPQPGNYVVDDIYHPEPHEYSYLVGSDVRVDDEGVTVLVDRGGGIHEVVRYELD